jgi:hypothetical protein
MSKMVPIFYTIVFPDRFHRRAFLDQRDLQNNPRPLPKGEAWCPLVHRVKVFALTPDATVSAQNFLQLGFRNPLIATQGFAPTLTLKLASEPGVISEAFFTVRGFVLTPI